MPELPDVEGFRRVVAEHAVRRRVRDVHVSDAQVLRDIAGRAFRNALRGRTFGNPWRHGKWLVLPVGGPSIMIHFGMTGALHWAEPGEDPHRHDRVTFSLARGQLRYRDMRKLKGIRLARDSDDVAGVLADLGPDALSVSRAELAERLGTRGRQLKPALADQAVLAGLGNLLVDELLWRAKLHPKVRTSDLSAPDVRRLHARMGTLLRQSADAGCVPPRESWLTGRRDDPAGTCPRCGTPLAHERVGGRGTVWCPGCQGASW